ncbi:conserved hypothetical protein [uncultured Defluviicoccus sp.]|uniref:Uncharacterized protein n=1 Tax=metagenome TaxID=256318 RepID=A0A380TJT3_9ZZZZ|nr:conserved hypothetical protein [uncultured Defluviicoccus sp.]
MGGGAILRKLKDRVGNGLSPRGRGSPRFLWRGFLLIRSIPAWAGEPSYGIGFSPKPAVYPRVGGGASTQLHFPFSAGGLSPRGRGSHEGLPHLLDVPGSIPAWAGEPRCLYGEVAHRRVYPRVGGGARPALVPQKAGKGLSPRGRGSLTGATESIATWWPTPAWAGEPAKSAGLSQRLRVYPRVGGGADLRDLYAHGDQGLSPRGRGSPSCLSRIAAAQGSIPAWAGEP